VTVAEPRLYGCADMTAPLRRVLVRRPGALERCRTYGWRAAPDPLAIAREHEAFCELLASAGADVVVGKPIDDDPDAIYLLQENLAEAGYQVVGARSGDEGIQKAKELHPYAITLDIIMPNKDGWQVLHDLKTHPATRDIPVILITIADKKALGYQLGAADYLVNMI
jgi:CheY-like chemotaxis protein